MKKLLLNLVSLAAAGLFVISSANAAAPFVTNYDGSLGITKTTLIDTNNDDIFDTFQTNWTDSYVMVSPIVSAFGNPSSGKSDEKPTKPTKLTDVNLSTRTFTETTYDLTGTTPLWKFDKQQSANIVYYYDLQAARLPSFLSNEEEATALSVTANNGNFLVNYKLGGNETVSMNVYSYLGELVTGMTQTQQSAGTYQVVVETASLTPGAYIISLRIGSEVFTHKVMLVK